MIPTIHNIKTAKKWSEIFDDKCKEYRIVNGSTIHNKVLLNNPKAYNNYGQEHGYQFY